MRLPSVPEPRVSRFEGGARDDPLAFRREHFVAFTCKCGAPFHGARTSAKVGAMNDFAQSPATIRIGDLEVCRLGYGAMQIPGPMVWGEPRDPERVRTVLKQVVKLGIQLIDTSWYYGPYVSNRFIAETLYPYPKDLVIATKLGGKRTPDKGWAAFNRPEDLRKGCEDDLRGLGLERIDLVHL